MSVGTVLLRLASALGLVGLNGFFVAVEFATVAVRRTRLEGLAETGSSSARLALKLVGNPDRVIAASQLGITIASLALGWIGEATIAALIEPPLETLLGRWSVAAAHTVGTALAFVLVTLTHIVVGEQVPKTVGIRYAEATMLRISHPVDAFIRVFRPLIAFLDGATALVLRLMRVEPIAGHRIVYTLDELRLIVRESQRGGEIGVQQEQMLQKVFRFGERQVREVMIPRPEVVGIEASATVRDLLAMFAEHSHARFPVFVDELDNVVGIVAIKDVLLALAKQYDHLDAPVSELARPAHFVPETVAVAALLGELRISHNQMAIVIDEYGGTAGIVTVEELVEEITGQLSDELVAGIEPIVRVDDQTAHVDAQLRVDEVNDQLGVQLPEGEQYETVAGMMLWSLQHIPRAGEHMVYGDLKLKVLEMRGPKIVRVEVTRL